MEDGSKIPVGCDKASGYLVFDVRMTLEHKSLWAKNWNGTPEPDWSNLAGVIPKYSARISFTRAVLNDLPGYSCDIPNSCFQAPSSEKHYVICSPDFGLGDVGKHKIIVRTLHGGKFSGSY